MDQTRPVSAVQSPYLCVCMIQALCKGVLTTPAPAQLLHPCKYCAILQDGIFKHEIAFIPSKMKEIWETGRIIRNTDSPTREILVIFTLYLG